MDALEGFLAAADRPLSEFLDKNSLRPRFAALADRCLDREEGVFATVIPTTALTATSGLPERLELARRFHIHTILTHLGVTDVNFSQGTHREMNESIIVLCRRAGEAPPATRIISLDRFPRDDGEAEHLFAGLNACESGPLPDGWGEVSYWPAEMIAAGDWSAVVWREPELATASARFAEHDSLHPMRDAGLSCHATGQLLRGDYRPSKAGESGAFPILKSKGAEAQSSIEGIPDQYWTSKQGGDPQILHKAGHLLLTAGQNTGTGRVTAVASNETYVGNSWMPVTGVSSQESKAAAVFLNSTVGHLLLMRHPGRALSFPVYSAEAMNGLPIPDMSDSHVVNVLVDCWEATRNETVPQFRDGYTPIRHRWDQAVCSALGWDIEEIAELGKLLAREPRVKGVAYGQWKA